MKNIPYGIADFDRIRNEGLYYIDKTPFIVRLEERGNFILLLRPRRFGKSLFTSMLMSYYDIGRRERFESLFGDLYIGQHPTHLHNTHLVLKLDFSLVGSSAETLEADFYAYCRGRIENMLDRYETFFTEGQKASILGRTTVNAMIDGLVSVAHDKLHLPLYLFVDEYDNFTNTVLSARGLDAHARITHGDGFYRDFFKACKGTFDRIYMTGVTPVTYDDLTSGFGIADIISLEPQFHQIVGISEVELREMIEYYRGEGRIKRPTDEIVCELKPWCDNYCFAEDCYGCEPTVYNTNMVLTYMRSILAADKTPKCMIDYSARTDYDKLNYLVMAEKDTERAERIATIREICATGQTSGDIVPQFPAFKAGRQENFKSMLYYYGTLTYAGFDGCGRTILRVPNKTMGDLYMGYMLNVSENMGFDMVSVRGMLDDAVSRAALGGELQPMMDAVGQCYSMYSGIRNAIRGEHDVQGFVRGLLCLNSHFVMWPELELNKGYTDILLVPNVKSRVPARYSYMIELKYMKAGEHDVEARVHEACLQLDRYVEDIHLTASGLLNGTPCRLVYMVFQGQSLQKSGVYKEISQ